MKYALVATTYAPCRAFREVKYITAGNNKQAMCCASHLIHTQATESNLWLNGEIVLYNEKTGKVVATMPEILK